MLPNFCFAGSGTEAKIFLSCRLVCGDKRNKTAWLEKWRHPISRLFVNLFPLSMVGFVRVGIQFAKLSFKPRSQVQLWTRTTPSNPQTIFFNDVSQPITQFHIITKFRKFFFVQIGYRKASHTIQSRDDGKKKMREEMIEKEKKRRASCERVSVHSVWVRQPARELCSWDFPINS